MRSILKFNFVFMLFFIVFIPMNAHAENQSKSINTGLYGVASIGINHFEKDKNVISINSVKYDNYSTTLSIGLGYNISHYISAEAGYIDLGESSTSSLIEVGYGTSSIDGSYVFTRERNIKKDSSGFYCEAQLKYPINLNISPYAKLGYSFWDTDVKEITTRTSMNSEGKTSASSSISSTEDSKNFYFGGGALFKVSQSISFRTEWVRHKVSENNVDLFNAAIVLNFRNIF